MSDDLTDRLHALTHGVPKMDGSEVVTWPLYADRPGTVTVTIPRPVVAVLAEARDEITRLRVRLSDSWYVDIGERLDAALTEVVRLRERFGLCPSCGDNGDCGETAAECGDEFHGNGEH